MATVVVDPTTADGAVATIAAHGIRDRLTAPLIASVPGHNGGMSADWLTGRLLVATPQIEEGIFHRSVVLILQHGADGAQGVVLNKPLEAEIDKVLPGWGEHVSVPQTLYQGGPVQVDSALGLVAIGSGTPTSVQKVFGRVGLVDLDAMPGLVAPELDGVRIFVGYAGWSPGQLETELAMGSWYAVDAATEDAFSRAPEDLWRAVLARQDGQLSWVALLPEDPSIN